MFTKKTGYDIFLGGTTNGSTWRDEFINILTSVNPKLKCFNPVVDDWTQECIYLENFVKSHAKYHVYVLTPRMRGVYSIAEMIDSVHDTSKKVVVYIHNIDKDDDGNEFCWDPQIKNSITAVTNMVSEHGGYVAKSLIDVAESISSDFNSTPGERRCFKI